jgi:alcohol dehydrogenase (cytochrome c)
VPWINAEEATGEGRKVVTGIPGKTGIFQSIDRETGQFLWARETVYQNAVLSMDENGRAEMNSDLFFTEADQTHEVCPSAIGGKDWMTGAYSPLTNVIYMPLHNLCMDATSMGDEPVVEELGQVDLGIKAAPGVENLGTIRGINVSTGEETWLNEQRTPFMSLLTTGGGLLFGGDMDRRFRAYDQETGEELWETILGGSIGGYPVSFAVDGKQYVAVASGPFLVSGMYEMLTPESRADNQGNTLYVFALPDSMQSAEAEQAE